MAVGYLWFLYFILLYYLVAPLLSRIPGWLPPLAALAISLLMHQGVNQRLFHFAVFFFLGAWISNTRGVSSWFTGRQSLWALGGLAAIFGVASAIRGVDLAYRGYYIPFSLAGILIGIWVATKFDNRRVGLIRFVGRNSIIYYVAHFPIMLLLYYAFDGEQ